MGYFHNLFINGTVGFLLQCIFSHLLLPYPKDVCLCKIMYSIKLIPNLWPTDIFALCRSTPTAVPVQPRRRISSKMSSKALISAAFFFMSGRFSSSDIVTCRTWMQKDSLVQVSSDKTAPQRYCADKCTQTNKNANINIHLQICSFSWRVKSHLGVFRAKVATEVIFYVMQTIRRSSEFTRVCVCVCMCGCVDTLLFDWQLR